MSLDDERSTAKQLSDEFKEDVRRMTDPEEHEKRHEQEEREKHLSDVENDAGI